MPSSATNKSRDFSPENRPVLNLLMAGLVTLSTGGALYQLGDASPVLVVAGFAVTAVGVGPVASSDFGQRVGEWFENIGVLGRFVIIASFAVAVYAVMFTYRPLIAPIQSAVFGSMLALDCYVVYRIAAHRLKR